MAVAALGVVAPFLGLPVDRLCRSITQAVRLGTMNVVPAFAVDGVFKDADSIEKQHPALDLNTVAWGCFCGLMTSIVHGTEVVLFFQKFVDTIPNDRFMTDVGIVLSSVVFPMWRSLPARPALRPVELLTDIETLCRLSAAADNGKCQITVVPWSHGSSDEPDRIYYNVHLPKLRRLVREDQSQLTLVAQLPHSVVFQNQNQTGQV